MKKTLSVILAIGFLICLMPAPVLAFTSDNKPSNSAYTDTAPQNASKPQSVIDASLKLKQSTQMVKSRFEMVIQKIQKKNAEQNEQQSVNNDSKNLEKPKTEKSKSIFLINHSASKTKPLS